MESIKQQQTSRLIQHNLAEIFTREGPSFYGRAFVTISGVIMTPDLMTARTYLSVYNVAEKEEVLKRIEESSFEIKQALYKRIRNKLRRMPELEFYLDGSLDEVDKLDKIFKDLKNDDKQPED